MIRLILIMVLLFSAATTAENLKHKRSNVQNMIMHMKCMNMANKSNLAAKYGDIHFGEYHAYKPLAWDDANKMIKRQYLGPDDYRSHISRYAKGFVDGKYGDSTKQEMSASYMNICQDNKLAFITSFGRGE